MWRYNRVTKVFENVLYVENHAQVSVTYVTHTYGV